jgi:hypothetical protein
MTQLAQERVKTLIPLAFTKTGLGEADGKCPAARLPKSRGMRRTEKYAAVTRDEDNAADGRFPTASKGLLGNIQGRGILLLQRHVTAKYVCQDISAEVFCRLHLSTVKDPVPGVGIDFL